MNHLLSLYHLHSVRTSPLERDHYSNLVKERVRLGSVGAKGLLFLCSCGMLTVSAAFVTGTPCAGGSADTFLMSLMSHTSWLGITVISYGEHCS